MGKWLELLGRLGRALLDLLSSELGSFADDLRSTRRELIKSVLLLALAGGFALLALGLGTLAAVWALGQVIPAWAAALGVAAIYGIAALIVGTGARNRLRRLEAPVDTFKRHWDDQRGWFQDRVLGEAPPSGEDLPEADPVIEDV
ncbi:MAG: phage holin family protein [Acidobacteriota bacterium]|nr:phage holin family protein [Acidobacteriota bacterium]